VSCVQSIANQASVPLMALNIAAACDVAKVVELYEKFGTMNTAVDAIKVRAVQVVSMRTRVESAYGFST